MEDRGYQIQAVTKVLEQSAAGKHVCLVSPTGSGKSVMGKMIVSADPADWAVLTHREELAEQLRGHLPGVPVLSWQKQAATREKHQYSRLLIDEAHHAGSPGPWGQTVREDFPNARRVGLTATPQRGDGAPLDNVFNALVVAANYSELLANGWLVPMRVFRPAEELDGLAKRPVDEYLERTPGEQAICFVGSMAEAVEVTIEFHDADVEAVYLTGATPEDVRKDTIARFRAGEIQVLVNIFVATEGFDVPDCSVCIIARGCESTATYLQMVGRALRPALGKVSATLLDLRGVSHRHGLPTQDRVYSLTGKAIQTIGALRLCPACGWCYEPGPAVCPSCGYRPTAEEERKQRILNRKTDLVTEKKPADLDELDRLLTLAVDNKWSLDWAVRAYLRTHERPRAWPPNLYNQLVASLRSKGKPRTQAYAIARSTLL